jgi:hypothetical protein
MAFGITEDSTDELEELTDLEVLNDEDDPLFGNFEKDKDLMILLSPKKKKRRIEIKIAPPKLKNKDDIIQQLKFHMKNPLDKELGFSINKSLRTNNNLMNSKDFKVFMEDIERKRKIANILDEDTEKEKIKEAINKNIDKWIESNVNCEFLNAEVDGTIIHNRWTLQLKKTLKSLISENNGVFDLNYINAKILEYPQYSFFKSFINNGIVAKNVNDISYIFKEKNLESLFESTDLHYVENFPSTIQGIKCEDFEKNFKSFLVNLGFDNVLIDNLPVTKRFDDKKELPISGCGIQVFKFVKLVEIEGFSDHCSIREILKVLILMSVDYNVCRDIQRFYYKGDRYSGREIAVMKTIDYQDRVVEVNKILRQLFEIRSIDLWFEFINNIKLNIDEELKIFKSKLIIYFLLNNEFEENDNDDDNEGEGSKYLDTIENFESINDMEILFTIFNYYLENFAKKYLRIKQKNLISIVHLKIELIKDLIIINDQIIRKWKKNSNNIHKYTVLKKSIHKIKHYYFKEYENSLNSIIPKCKRILDFLYHEVTDIDVLDFFVKEENE